jgi:tRNA A37 N6-isopentenylltransferase MiaA
VAEAKRYPACRLVLTAAAAAALYNRLHQTVAAMAEAGLIAKAPLPATPA